MNGLPIPRGSGPTLGAATAVGLRLDVTSRRGVEEGLPRLDEVFTSTGARASLFVSMGPDRTGWCILPYLKRPHLLPGAVRLTRQMRLPSTTFLSGLLLPARPPVQGGVEIIRRMVAGGHEAGCLGYDYWKWINEIPKGPSATSFAVLDQEAALEAYRGTFGRVPVASASPGFLCSEETLRAKDTHGLHYASDCRGTDPFFPTITGKSLATPQVPVTLPTIAELLSERGTSPTTAYDTLLGRALEEKWPVLRIRAEWEGGAFLKPFVKFLEGLGAAGRRAVPLGALLGSRLEAGPLPRCTLSYGELEGRPGIVSLQMFEV